MCRLSKLLVAACPMVWALSAGSIVSNQALAADFPTPMEYQVTTESGFEVNIVPLYLWLPGMNGKVGVFGAPPIDVDLTPIDIVSLVPHPGARSPSHVHSGHMARHIFMMWQR